MKFSKKYPNAKPGELIGEDCLLVIERAVPCYICGEPTIFTECAFDTPLCSEECYENLLNDAEKLLKIVKEPENRPLKLKGETDMEERKKTELSKVVLVEPDKPARVVEMDLSLESMQKTVGGLIQAIYPWEDPVALVCNDEGKLLEMPPNRALEDEKGDVYDIVRGTFFICGLTEDDFGGLTDEQARLYFEKFLDRQTFTRDSNGKLLIIVHHEVEEEA